ncbi:TetR/AcrR family transcriptional regulator [Actinacidiphila glaucinigra]|uniref:TetR/AcrR family transcriptional regulator n=1 Tax=Actinacidiphila glaucinigra TaxID=235986 RepID=UPI0037152F6F
MKRKQAAAAEQPTLDAVAKTALAVIDEDGPAGLSFRAVAQRLGVSHATVFRRCGDFDGLLSACADRVAASLPLVPPEGDWAAATETRFTGLYRLLSRHPGLVALRAGRSWLGPQMLGRLVEPQMAHSVAAGMDADTAIRVYRRLYLLTLGAVAFGDPRDEKKAVASARAALAALDPEDFPTLTGAMNAVLPVLVDHGVYYEALRALIHAARAEHLPAAHR